MKILKLGFVRIKLCFYIFKETKFRRGRHRFRETNDGKKNSTQMERKFYCENVHFDKLESFEK